MADRQAPEHPHRAAGPAAPVQLSTSNSTGVSAPATTLVSMQSTYRDEILFRARSAVMRPMSHVDHEMRQVATEREVKQLTRAASW